MSAAREGDSLKEDLKQQHAVHNAAFHITLYSTVKTQLGKKYKSKLRITEYIEKIHPFCFKCAIWILPGKKNLCDSRQPGNDIFWYKSEGNLTFTWVGVGLLIGYCPILLLLKDKGRVGASCPES